MFFFLRHVKQCGLGDLLAATTCEVTPYSKSWGNCRADAYAMGREGERASAASYDSSIRYIGDMIFVAHG